MPPLIFNKNNNLHVNHIVTCNKEQHKTTPSNNDFGKTWTLAPIGRAGFPAG